MAQLKDRGKIFTEEVHLKKDDPNYGRPQEGKFFFPIGGSSHIGQP